MKHTRAFVMALLLLCLLAAACAAGCAGGGRVVISEVVSSNRNSYVHKTLGTPDWIELHNPGERPVRLAGYILTDKPDAFDPGCILPDITLAPGGYCVIPADGQAAGGDAFCLPFGVSRLGETLYLLNPAGRLIDSLAVPELGEDVSYAVNGERAGYCMQPTPGRANAMPLLDALEPAAALEPSELTLLISEVVTGAADGGADWVELYNPGPEDVPLDGCFLSDRADDPRRARLSGVVVPAGGHAVIDCTDELGLALAAEGEALLLCDAYSRLIDRVDVPALPRGQSWARRADGSFGYCGAPTRGLANEDARIGGEPFTQMGAEEPVRISEALFDNAFSAIDSYGDRSDWVELYNAGAQSVSLLGYYLSDDADDPTRFALPDVTLAPGEYRLVFLSGRASTPEELHADFSVSERDDGCLLYHGATRGVDLVPWVDGLAENVSIGRGADGAPVYYAYPTPGQPNAQAVDDPALLAAYPADGVYISEVCAGGPDGDWIELHNGGGEAADLTGWALSDDAWQLRRFPLEAMTLAPGAYCAIAVSPDGAAGFGVSLSGETLLLSDAQGQVRDVFRTGALQSGRTSGRTAAAPDAARVFFSAPTRGRANSASFTTGRTPAPTFSETALYRDGPFLLTLSCADADAAIRYTLDGSEPGPDDALYAGPIQIDASVTVRTAAFGAGLEPSPVQTQHYLFEPAHTLPVVCIACEPALWSRLMRSTLNAVAREGPAAISYYEADGTLGTVFPAAIRARGNTSLKYAQKSVSVHLRPSLGQRTVTYPFWGAGSAAAYGTLVLRNASQDIAAARLRDSFANRAAAGLRLDCAATRPVVVYVNGAYHGVYDLNEGMNQDYLEAHYGVDPDTVNIVGKNAVTRHGSAADYARVRRYARGTDFTEDAALEAFGAWVDVAHVTDYLIAQTFFGNYDIHNQNCWASDDYAIRWRPYLYDVDRCLCPGRSELNLFQQYFNAQGVAYNPSGDRVNMDIYCALRENAAWRDAFLDRYAQLLCSDFSVDRLTALLDEMAAALRPEMERHIARWGLPASLADWEAGVAAMRAEIPLRHAAIQRQLQQEFGLTPDAWAAYLARHAGP